MLKLNGHSIIAPSEAPLKSRAPRRSHKNSDFVVTVMIEQFHTISAFDAKAAGEKVMKLIEQKHGKKRVTITEVEEL